MVSKSVLFTKYLFIYHSFRAIVHTDIECLDNYFRIKLKLFSTCNFIERLLDENWRPNYSFDKLEWLARQMNCRVEHLVGL
mmetsp:Transcript_278/g.244  ORF Transcript_278/g.244 Transcript_278/m.244 type:complete len:81 (+) Transcript_278:488-730(+)